MKKIIEGYLVDRKGYVREYGFFKIVKGNKVRTENEFEYPLAWVKTELTKKQKKDYARFWREIWIADIRLERFKDPTLGTKWGEDSIKEIRSMTDDEVLTRRIEEYRDIYMVGM